MDTAREVFAWTFWHYRAAAGTVSECARMAGYSHGLLSDIEHGKKVPSLDVARDLDQALGARGVIINTVRILREADRKAASIDLEDHADPTDDGEMGEVERRQLLRALGMTGAAGLAGRFGHVEAVRATLENALDRSVEEWQEVAWEYGLDLLALPPAEVVDDLAADVLAVRRLLDRPGSVGDRASLQRVAGQLSAVMAMTFANLGEVAHARRWWRTARTAADRSGDAELATWVRARQAVYGQYERRGPRERLRLADTALAHAPSELGAGKVAALGDRAQALAKLGDTSAATAATEDVANAFERLPDSVTADRASVYGWSEQRLRHVQTYVYAHTGDSRAPSARDTALAVYPERLYQEPTLVRLYHAAWLVRTGDPTEGVRHATEAVNGLAREYRDHAVMTVACDVEGALPAGAENTPEAVEYHELLALPSPS